MPSPSHVKDAPAIHGSPKSLVIRELTRGDSELTRRVCALAKSDDDPPVLFDWDHQALTRFWKSAVAYHSTAIAPVVIPINGGVALPLVVDVELLKREILAFVRTGAGNSLQAPYPEIIGSTLGLACTSTQCQVCAGILSRLEFHPWFAAVLAHPAEYVVGQLASIWTPRPRVSSGICNQLCCGSFRALHWGFVNAAGWDSNFSININIARFRRDKFPWIARSLPATKYHGLGNTNVSMQANIDFAYTETLSTF